MQTISYRSIEFTFKIETISTQPSVCKMLIEHQRVVATLAQHGISITAILHLGAHECEELADYEKQGVTRNRIVWVEALASKVQACQKKGIPNVIEAVVDTESGTKLVFYETNNGQSSSFLRLKTHKKQYPHIVVVKEHEKETTTIDLLF